ncbi:MAG: cytochrome c family protein [Pseudolabrys sp.]|nr:cytochrome c family protein [Pseudolabrys sp.]
MNSFELNKILGAVLATCLGLLSLNIAASAIFSPVVPEKPGYEIAVKEAATDTAAAKEESQPIEVLLASASSERGAATTKQCSACHSLEKGGPNRVGPHLWDVVNRPVASVEGFNYSAALKGKGGNWTFDELNKFLRSPRTHVPGTTMAYAGISRDQARADVIDYLRTHADNPVPLPATAAAPAAPAPAGAAPAGAVAPTADPATAPAGAVPAGAAPPAEAPKK